MDAGTSFILLALLGRQASLILKVDQPHVPATPQASGNAPSNREVICPMQASCISAAPSHRLFQRFNLNTWVLPCVGVFACFLDLNSAWSVNRIVHWLMTLIMAEIIFLLVLSKFFLDSALMWGLRVDHSTLRKAKCSKDFLKDCPGPVELYLIFFFYIYSMFLKASINIKCIQIKWCPYFIQETVWPSG